MDVLSQIPQAWFPVVDAAAKAAMVLSAATILAWLLRGSSAATRHMVWTSALVAALALPLLGLGLPRWEAPLLTVPQPSPSVVGPMPTSVIAATRANTTIGLEGPAPEAARGVGSIPVAGGGRAPLSWTAIAATIWLAGTALILGRLLLGIVLVQVMSARSEVVTDARWLPLAYEIAGDLGVSRVTFRRGAPGTMPMAWGVIKPVVLMPADADDWHEGRLRIVLLHELAHVKRADCLTHMLAQSACALYWMNPLSWIAARGARTERERACDDLVLAHGTRGADYADELLALARTLDHDRSAPAIAGASLAMAYRSHLEGRLMSILDPNVRRSGISRFRAAGFATLALAVTVSLGTMQTWAFEEEAMLPHTGKPRPNPKPLPLAAPAPNDQAQPRVTESAGAGNQAVGQGIASSASKAAEQQALTGLVEGVIGGIAQGVIEGVAAGIGQGVAEGIAEGVQQGAARGGRRETDPKLVAALMEALKDSDRQVREAAMQALVHMRAPGMVDPLIQTLKDPSADLRERAAFGLGQLRDPRAVPPLIGAVNDESASVREQAVFALGQLRDPSAAPALIGALKDENASVREQAAFALGQLRAREAVDPLIASLQDESGSVREQAAFALGQLRDARAADALMALLKDPNSQVRQQAAFALGQLSR